MFSDLCFKSSFRDTGPSFTLNIGMHVFVSRQSTDQLVRVVVVVKLIQNSVGGKYLQRRVNILGTLFESFWFVHEFTS